MDGRRVTNISDSIFASCCSDVTLNTRRRFVNLETVAFANKFLPELHSLYCSYEMRIDMS